MKRVASAIMKDEMSTETMFAAPVNGTVLLLLEAGAPLAAATWPACVGSGYGAGAPAGDPGAAAPFSAGEAAPGGEAAPPGAAAPFPAGEAAPGATAAFSALAGEATPAGEAVPAGDAAPAGAAGAPGAGVGAAGAAAGAASAEASAGTGAVCTYCDLPASQAEHDTVVTVNPCGI